jgi:1-deoxy-D-xylulose-5-phosphate synthase
MLLRRRTGADVCLVAVGSMVGPALAAADLLGARNIATRVVDARFVKPLDEATLLEAARETRRLVTVEENVLAGGFGSAVLECLASHREAEGVQVLRLGLPDAFIEHGSPELLRDLSGLTASGICGSVLAAFPELQMMVESSTLG